MTDETEVILANYDVLPNDTLTWSENKSPAYTDTEVTEEDRTVKFWNTLNFSDSTNGKIRRARGGIKIDTGAWAWTSWYNYTSPLSIYEFKPEDTISVPHNGPSHDYDVYARIQVEESSGVIWTSKVDRTSAAETATVNESD